MKKLKYTGLCLLLSTLVLLPSCDNNKNDKVENYYVINVSSIRNEMLVNTVVKLEPTFTNLGEVANPNYSVEIKLNNNDITSTVYNPTTKEFSPTIIGSYVVNFKVLNEDNSLYVTSDGKSFSQTITIEVVRQSFAPRDNAGSDVIISDDGIITFGSSYSKGSNTKLTSNQYKVTGVTFEDSYSITYGLSDIKYDSIYSDPALYFGWVRNRNENNDDSIKLSSGNGTMAAWIWSDSGDLADLSVNRNQGWAPGGWYNAPGSITNGSPLEGNHTITFERYVNTEKNTAVYGIIFDGVPYTYLNVGSNYTDILTNVWVESNNTSGSIGVKEYKVISDTQAPTISMNFADSKFSVGDTINFKSRTTVSDDSVYSSVLTPTYQVFDKNNDEQVVDNGTFTPTESGTYRVVASVNDLGMNNAKKETTFTVTDADLSGTVIDVTETSSVAMPNSGIVLYYDAKKNDKDVSIKSIKVLKGTEDVTESTLFTYTSKDKTLSYEYFKAPVGNYKLVFEAEDGTLKEKEISVSESNTTVYGFTYYDIGTLVYQDKFIVGKDMIIYTNNQNSDAQTVKLGKGFKDIYNWTIKFDVTDLSYSAQGKFFITKNTLNSEGNSIGWEDLTIGGNCKADGSLDFWGYECSVLGTGWVSYQWRSNWQNPTTEFMPDPTDNTKGCGRPADAYSQYGIGTHSYKISCSMDETTNVVTYKYYIDNELEVVHVTNSEHNDGNGLDFIQFSGQYFNGIVSNIKIS